MRLAKFFAFVWLVLAPMMCEAAPRIALVIGNAAYGADVGPLINPHKDAALIAQALESRGFVVTIVLDAGRVPLLTAIDDYARKLAGAGPDAIGFLYYSGHGAANPDDGRNYLIPTDVTTAADDRLWYQSVPLQEMVERIRTIAANAHNIVVFDACREALRLPKGKGLGGGSKGLARVPELPSVLIAFSTSPGALAADQDSAARTGPFATELGAQLNMPGQDVAAMFENVRLSVLERTGQHQLPYVENGLRTRVYLNGSVLLARISTDLAAPAPLTAVPLQSPLSGLAANLARWGLSERELSTLSQQDLVAKAGGKSRLGEFRQAAVDGDPVAMLLTANIFNWGLGIAANPETAAEFYRKAALAGVAPAMATIGTFYRDGYGVPQDYTLALQFFRLGADKGDREAMNNLGMLYAEGKGAPHLPGRAVMYFRQAAELGSTAAMHNLGEAYGSGDGVEQDHAEQMQWYLRAADAGLTTAMNDIAILYEHGEGLKQDYAKAMQWYRRSGDAGDRAAMFNVGRLYKLGWGVTKDDTQAAQWFRKAADAKLWDGMYFLGLAYENGEGVPRNIDLAVQWYHKAADDGFEKAIDALKRLGR